MSRLVLLHLFCFLLLIGRALGQPAELSDALALEGLTIQKVSFRTSRTLDSHDLGRNLPIGVNQPFRQVDLEASVRKLYERHIFEHIDTKVITRADGVEVEFLLTSAPTVAAIEFVGFSTLNERQLRRLAGLRLDEPVQIPALLQAQERIIRGYEKEGHFVSRVKVEIVERLVTPQVIVRFKIQEGYRAMIARAELGSTLPEDLLFLPEALQDAAKDLPASVASLKALRQQLLAALRKEGYLQASVDYEATAPDVETGDVTVRFEVDPRTPVSIIFSGNTLFSSAELLAPLRLESRTVPFTPSAILSLAKEIERMYEARGYFFARVEAKRLVREGMRRIYEVAVTEGAKVNLRKILFRGNEVFGDSRMLQIMETRPRSFSQIWDGSPGYIQKETISSDLIAIEDLYRRSGYPRANASFELLPVEGTPQIDLIITIAEGDMQRVSEVELVWEGVLQNPEQRAADHQLLTLRSSVSVGEPFDLEELRQEQSRLTEVIQQRGYPNAFVELEANSESGVVRFVVQPGPQIIVRSVLIAGNFFTHDEVIRRELRLRPGDVLRLDDLKLTEQKLYELGIFRSVSVQAADGSLDSPQEDIMVKVAERDTGSLQLEGDFNSQDGLHLAGELGQRNLGGTGEALVLSLDGYFKTGSRLFDAGSARARFTEPKAFGLPADLFTEVYAQYSIKLVDPFSYDRLGASTTMRVPVGEDVTADLGWNMFLEDLFDVPQDVIIDPDDAEPTFFSFLNMQLDWDRRDSPYNSRKGHRTLLQGRFASEALGSEVNFFALTAQETVYVPLSPRTVWVNNVRGSYLVPFGSTNVIPLSQRLFLGGRNSVRGFSKHVIGPRGVDGFIAGGDVGLVMNTELQYDLFESVTVVLFLDAGQTYLLEAGTFEGTNENFSKLRYSPGFGMRYKTPIGPVSLDVGFNPEPEFGERWGRVNFAVGSAF